MKRTFLLIMLLIVGCEPKVTEQTFVYEQKYWHGQKVRVVEHVVTVDESSMLSPAKPVSVTFTYKVYWSPGRVYWDATLIHTGSIQQHYSDIEPKMITPCKEQLYLKYYHDGRYEEIVSSNGRHKHKAFYAKHVNERYFFDFFGEQHWVTIDEAEYQQGTEKCDEYWVPTSGRLEP